MKFTKKWMVVPYQPKVNETSLKNIRNISGNNLTNDYEKLKLYNHYLALNNNQPPSIIPNEIEKNSDIINDEQVDQNNQVNDQSLMDVDKTVIFNKPILNNEVNIIDDIRNEVTKSLNNALAKNKIYNEKFLKKLMESSYMKLAPADSTRKKTKNKKKSIINLSLSKIEPQKIKKISTKNNKNDNEDDAINEISSMLNTAYNESANESTMGRLYLEETKNADNLDKTNINKTKIDKIWSEYRE